jgi:hypothetical protein
MAEKTFTELVDSATEAARLTDAPLSERLRAVADEVQRLSPKRGFSGKCRGSGAGHAEIFAVCGRWLE